MSFDFLIIFVILNSFPVCSSTSLPHASCFCSSPSFFLCSASRFTCLLLKFPVCSRQRTPLCFGPCASRSSRCFLDLNFCVFRDVACEIEFWILAPFSFVGFVCLVSECSQSWPPHSPYNRPVSSLLFNKTLRCTCFCRRCPHLSLNSHFLVLQAQAEALKLKKK